MCAKNQERCSHGSVDPSPSVLQDGSVIESLGGAYRKTCPDGTVIIRILGNSQTDRPDGTRTVEWSDGTVWDYSGGEAVSVKHPDGRVETFLKRNPD